MPSQTVTLENETGLHARPARVFAKKAKEFDCDVKVRKTSDSGSGRSHDQDGDAVNAKSTLSVLTLDCHKGDQIEIITDGDNADDALSTLVELVESGLGE
ncbi:MAG TPA: HPr family phosphocarrier protein [Euzebyales bacterium]